VFFILNQRENAKLLMEQLPCFIEFSFEKQSKLCHQIILGSYLEEIASRAAAHCALSDLTYAWTGNLKLSARDWLWLD